MAGGKRGRFAKALYILHDVGDEPKRVLIEG
jgi:hypothetical protein